MTLWPALEVKSRTKEDLHTQAYLHENRGVKSILSFSNQKPRNIILMEYLSFIPGELLNKMHKYKECQFSEINLKGVRVSTAKI